MSMEITITVVFLAGYYALCGWMLRGLRVRTRDLAISGIMIAMTLILDSIRIPLPTGASLPLCSLVPLMLLAILWSPKLAILSGWVCGVAALVLIPVWQPMHWAQVFAEHLVCFSCLGFAGCFGSDKRWKILCGILVASGFKILGHTISGVLFYSQNAWGGWDAWAYSAVYNLTQGIPLCALCGVVVLVLPLQRLKRQLEKGRGK